MRSVVAPSNCWQTFHRNPANLSSSSWLREWLWPYMTECLRLRNHHHSDGWAIAAFRRRPTTAYPKPLGWDMDLCLENSGSKQTGPPKYSCWKQPLSRGRSRQRRVDLRTRPTLDSWTGSSWPAPQYGGRERLLDRKGTHGLRLCCHRQPQVDAWLQTGLLQLSLSTQVKAASETLWWIPGAMKEFLGLHLMLVMPIPIIDDSFQNCKIKI